MKAAKPILFATTLMLIACGSSPPTRYFALTPIAPAGHAPASAPFRVQLDAVRIPEMIDRNEIVRQTGANSMSISEQDRWGAPFGEMATNVLAQDLTQRMPVDSVLLPGAPAPSNVAHLIVNLTEFRETPDRIVHLDGSWTLMRGESAKSILNNQIRLERTATGIQSDAQAAAMSELLAGLADQIAGNITAHR